MANERDLFDFTDLNDVGDLFNDTEVKDARDTVVLGALQRHGEAIERLGRQSRRSGWVQMGFGFLVAAIPFSVLYAAAIDKVDRDAQVHINSDTAVDRAYQQYLGRNPEGGNDNNYKEIARKAGIDDALVSFYRAPKVQKVTVLMSNQEYVNSIYDVLYGAQPDQTGNVHWVDALNEGKSREWVAQAILNEAL